MVKIASEELKDKDWFSPQVPLKGADFTPEDLRPGMIFRHHHYNIILTELQILKHEEIVAIGCHVIGGIVEFTDAISIGVINKAFYIGSTTP